MGYTNELKYPEFANLLIKYNVKSLNEIIDLCLISHFHLDHCAAIPVLIEDFGFNGPVVASEPTKAIIPYMLEDYMKVSPDNFYNYTKPKIE